MVFISKNYIGFDMFGTKIGFASILTGQYKKNLVS